ncbi:D-aminoacyl-tRNA deacylase [Ferroacidibacillus organovorans]|uniref:D-aminoacyl-tRNA deacylase n=1 Tax=Ferroacidibacillus organovorans TaxID=1765683 RepID=A0A161PXT1_9BACL|nr:D-aminoacyl-tRNA deacylase [Ferroacidibacillus organovorans]KYP80685.1 D-tyrosyl-tRNA(Tyr) deacylase [Ferroacidibacillus organovorans]OAG93284.1 D-tyrosyl-tRNA(Tyr) deacylase [Ferroacidibacillus organovorans]OPG15927.1 D-tyrosyl-tRNA(Tyr) deacylase [Ferroacidibacillus organovorans]
MRVVLQRVRRGRVTVAGRTVGEIDRGVVLLVGFTHTDAEPDLTYLADKILNLRIFEDPDGKMNDSLLDVGGHILSVSQFTLYADARKGRRPSFIDAARPEKALPLYERFNELLAQSGLIVRTGQFGAMMDVELINDGPVTIVLDTAHL